MDVFADCPTDKDTCDQSLLILRFLPVEGRANFEQRHVVETTRLITRSSLQQAGQKRRAHMAHLGRNRVGEHGCIRTTAEKLG